MKALIPANIVAGFRTCGVFPFNPAAISVPEKQGRSNSDGGTGRSDESSDEDGEKGDGSDREGNNAGDGNDFTDEQRELFERRFSEGYDLDIDQDYLCWRKIYYPKASSCDSSAEARGSDGGINGEKSGSGADGHGAVGGGAVGGGAVGGRAVGGRAVGGGAVGGDLLPEDWEFPDKFDFTLDQWELFNNKLRDGYDPLSTPIFRMFAGLNSIILKNSPLIATLCLHQIHFPLLSHSLQLMIIIQQQVQDCPL